MVKNKDHVSHSVRRLGEFWEYSVKVANKNGNGYTIWKKYTNSSGRTIKLFHETYDKTNKFLFRKFVNGRERIEVWWNGVRSWYSKL